MRALIQRVTHAEVVVDEKTVGVINHGMLALIGVEADDNAERADKLLHRLLHYRIFGDEDGRMNQSVQDVNGGLLLVSQFTLVADTSRGLRPGFSRAAPPDVGRQWFEYLLKQARERWPRVASGQFGAHMQIALTNDGPVTFLLET